MHKSCGGSESPISRIYVTPNPLIGKKMQGCTQVAGCVELLIKEICGLPNDEGLRCHGLRKQLFFN